MDTLDKEELMKLSKKELADQIVDYADTAYVLHGNIADDQLTICILEAEIRNNKLSESREVLEKQIEAVPSNKESLKVATNLISNEICAGLNIIKRYKEEKEKMRLERINR